MPRAPLLTTSVYHFISLCRAHLNARCEDGCHAAHVRDDDGGLVDFGLVEDVDGLGIFAIFTVSGDGDVLFGLVSVDVGDAGGCSCPVCGHELVGVDFLDRVFQGL